MQSVGRVVLRCNGLCRKIAVPPRKLRQRPDRVLFPKTGFTKDDAIEYYQSVATWLLPHLRKVPVSFKRYPDTVRGESFWEKDAPSFTPEWVRTVAVRRRGGESDINYILINNVPTLTWVADAGGIEIHPFLHRTPRIDRATSVVFDLDPGEGASIKGCGKVALLLRDALAALKLTSFAKVSGSKGLQVYVPLNGYATHEATEGFARFLAEELARRDPKRVVAKMGKQFRARKVFIDWSQNADYKTTVSVYSLRATRDRPFVSMPVTWEEVESGEVLEFDPEAAIKRLKKMGDLFAPVLRLRQRIPLPLGGGSSTKAEPESDEVVIRGIRLPRPRSQSGRRLFLVPKSDMGNELWMDMRGKFKRWILRPDREGGRQLVAMPAGEFAIDPSYFRGEVPAEWRDRISIADIGSYELIDGSFPRRRFDLWFSGNTLSGEWILEKVGDDSHRSWTLTPTT
jgi:bifunctional non-homologous end joining protein LigD